MDLLVKQEDEPTGPDWFTVNQFAARYRMSRPGAAQRLDRMYEDGRLERWKGVSATTKRMTTKFRAKERDA